LEDGDLGITIGSDGLDHGYPTEVDQQRTDLLRRGA
jgi:hypothetical protein